MSEKKIIAIDLGGTNLKIAVVDSRFRIKAKQILSTQKFHKKEELISAIVYSINKIISSNKLSKKDILGVGLGLPGPVDTVKGLVHFFPNIPGWKEVNLKRVLRAKIGLKVFLDNDAKLMSLAEYKLGAAKGAKNAVCITLGTGVGGGIIIEGKLYRGATNAAGEIGHLPINEKGPDCACGGKACLEKYIGNSAIINEANRIFGKKYSLEELSILAKKQDKRAKQIWFRVGERLGIALTQVVNLLSPDCIVVGGGVANAGDALFTSLKKTIINRAMGIQAGHVKIKKARLGSDAGLAGAAILVKESVG